MALRLIQLVTIVTLLLHSTSFAKEKRSLDLTAAHNLINEIRLPGNVIPLMYHLDIHPYPEEGIFKGRVKINMTWLSPSSSVYLNVHEDLVVRESDIIVTQLEYDDETKSKLGPLKKPRNIKVIGYKMYYSEPQVIVALEDTIQTGTKCEIDIPFSGQLHNDTNEALYRSNYVDPTTGEKKWFVASYFRPNYARNVFPCFDEPAFKAPFLVSIVRPNTMRSLSNMPVYKSEVIDAKWVRDFFLETPPMSTFSLGFLISELVSVGLQDYNTSDDGRDVKIKVWARPDFAASVQLSDMKIQSSLIALSELWGTPYPLPKLDCVALPNYQATRPADNWGLIFFRESELSSNSQWPIIHELVYQWLGTLATPYWWSESDTNNALARYIATYTTLKLSNGQETFHNWPMTMLYSIYYEYSKRYPHGKVMAVKQDSVSTKAELLFRMLNYTLSEQTFIRAMKNFMNDKKYDVFYSNDIWESITKQGRIDGTLDNNFTVSEIAASWVNKDRLPVLNVIRNYTGKSATLSQRVYLRERPHDVPDQERYLWYIPIILIREDNINFSNTKPLVWMKYEREIQLESMPEENQFIVVNPEEIGPFPVNYDVKNWNLLAAYLQTDQGRINIPVNTRAKLLHDAWNLAYAGDLNFATALNMTLFLEKERDYLAWDPVFTMIDHIGRHIDSSKVHKKFLTYVRILLTPLYEELGEQTENEPEGKTTLRNSAKVFLCQAGYKPCIEEAQAAFDKWMVAENPEEGNPVSNQYICPVFKWGTKEEWEFGLQRVIKFPASRKLSERTYLLKTLAGCPVDEWKIQKLLNITILEKNGNFSDNDVFLIFSMLTGGSSGYTTLFNYLETNWDRIRKAFQIKPQLWNSIVASSTSVFKTQEGLDMVTNLHSKRKGQFDTGEFIIEKAMKNIKEEASWSNENLPVIEKWLDNYLTRHGEENKNNKFL